ncbi:MAG: glycosyltransferase [Mogibacterium sp.]|nr:glycosyltransferase [Mogibacterium sp.]
MTKICHMTSVHKSNDIRIFEKECSSLAKKPEYKVWLVAQGDSRNENNVEVIGIGEKPSSRIKRILLFSRQVYKESKKLDADVYHFHDPELLPFGLMLKKQGKKVIFDSHENYSYQIKTREYMKPALRKIISASYYRLETMAAKHFDAVIFPCKMNGKHPFEGRSKRPVFINNAPIFTENDTDRAAQQDSEFTACYVGGLSEPRGITKSILAASKAGVKLVLAGRFDSDSYEQKLRAMPEFECVDYKGQCSHEEVYNILASCSVGLSVLQNVGQYKIIETLPTKVYEYMQMKMPVIMGISSYAKELNDEYKFAELVDPGNEDEIAEAINRLRKDPEKCQEMGNNGYELVKNHLNWAVEEEKLYKLYQEILTEE